jgi:hypothetical protein
MTFLGLLWFLLAGGQMTCTAGEETVTGLCGIGMLTAGIVFMIALVVLPIAVVILVRGLLRRIDANGSAVWERGQAFYVMACGLVIGSLIPQHACPEGMTLSPVFRFCTSVSRSFAAPSPGLKWKISAGVVGIVLGVLILKWRRMPWWVASLIAVSGTAGIAWLTLTRVMVVID